MVRDVSRQRDGLTSLKILTAEVRSTSRLHTGCSLADRGRTTEVSLGPVVEWPHTVADHLSCDVQLPIHRASCIKTDNDTCQSTSSYKILSWFHKTTTTNVNDISLQLNNWSTETKQIFIMRHKWWNYNTV